MLPAQQIADSIYANNFCSEVLMYMTWGRENGDPQWGPISTFEGMNTRLRNAYVRIANSLQGSVCPVGSAWRYVRDNYPTINLYAGDGSHPSLEGSYLAACTFYAAVFRKSPIGASFTSGLPSSVVAELQYAASITVLDSLETWNLRPLSEHTQANFSFSVNNETVDFSNESTKALNYYWDFGDSGTSIQENPSHVYSSNGTFTVELVAESPCDLDTITFEITIDAVVGISENEESTIKLCRLNDSRFRIDGEFTDFEILNTQGQIIDANRSASEFNLSGMDNGIYFCKIILGKKRIMIKFPFFSN
ncbi:MAG TPA: PKD domain-containing protein [Crocinitomicaceae bacterium]|nr:PKD domain-containing protein [Crocinitomicaceae bacterium]